MVKLMKLELKRNRMRSYISATLILTIVMIGFLYLFAAIPFLEETQTDIEMFMTYDSIATLVCMISMVSFSILSSVMYARFIVEEYAGNKVILLFSYPVNRRNILWAKIAVVFFFTLLSMLLSGLATFAVFYATEFFMPLCQDTLTLFTIVKTASLLLVYSLMSCALAVISLWFGLWKKSTPATIVSGTIIVTVVCNFLAVGISNMLLATIALIIGIVIALVLITGIASKISTMEVE